MITVRVATILKIDKLWYNSQKNSMFNFSDMINSTNIIQIQDKLIINYAIQKQCQTNIISKFKIFLNSQD